MRVPLTIAVFILLLAVRQTHATDSSSAHDTSQERSVNIQKRRLSLQNTGTLLRSACTENLRQLMFACGCLNSYYQSFVVSNNLSPEIMSYRIKKEQLDYKVYI